MSRGRGKKKVIASVILVKDNSSRERSFVME
jgi:hypothetical protein